MEKRDAIPIWHWQEEVWYRLIIIIILISAVVTPVSSRDTFSSPVTMDQTSLSPNKVHKLSVSVETQSSDSVNRPYSDSYDTEPADYADEDDSAFWEGVEEVDLTLPFSDLEEENLEEVFYFMFNGSAYLEIDCEDFAQMDPPPRWNLPPPPLFPVIGNMKHLLQNFDQKEEEEEESAASIPQQDLEECYLCKWATGNHTFTHPKPTEESGTLTNSMIGSLVGVAFVSAALGAALMSFLLKCKRGDPHSSCVRGSCPVLILRRGYPKSTSETPETNNRTEVQSPAQSTKSESESGIGWTLRRWRRSSSQAPLNLCSSPGSENSYMEEQYINCDSNSAVYAELNPDGGFPLPDPSAVVSVAHSYTEIPNFTRSSEADVCRGDSKCVNVGYIPSESPPGRNESSSGSASTPSSAYYSDVSSCEIAANSKTRRTRSRSNERLKMKNNASATQYNVPSISTHIEYRPVHLNMNAIQSQHIPSSGSLPLSLQLLPKQLNVDPNCILEGVSSGSHLKLHRQTTPLNLSQNRLLTNVTNFAENFNKVYVQTPQPLSLYGHYDTSQCGHGPYEATPPGHYEASSCGHYEGIYEDDLMVIKHCAGTGHQRPLPPLPSRRLNGPKRKRIEQEIPALTSNYV